MIEIQQKRYFSTSNKNLFIISNEMQLLNAKEAQYYYKSQNTIFVFLEFPYKQDTLRLYQYKENLDCELLITVKFDGIYLFQDIQLIKYLQNYIYDNVYVGYFSERIRYYIANINYQRLILVDDGTYVVALHNELHKGISKHTPSMLKTLHRRKRNNSVYLIMDSVVERIKQMIFAINGLRYDLKYFNIIFFTIYNLKLYKNEIIIKNNFNLLKKLYNNITYNKNIIYFLGQPLNKSMSFTSQEYIGLLKKIIVYYKKRNIKIYYIPHRSESLEYKTHLNLLISNYFVIKYIDKPFELYLLEETEMPFGVASFFSSALFTSKMIDNSLDITSFLVSKKQNLREDILSIYKLLEEDNVQTILL